MEPATKKLDFVIAGVQKAGTTALHSFMRTHSKIWMPEQKELHFFDGRQADWSKPDYSALERQFSYANPSAQWGEATPIYIFWKPALDRLRHYNPDLKLIVLVRNPVERAYSQWAMGVARNGPGQSFSEAIRDQRGRYSDFHGTHLRIVDRGFYHAQLSYASLLFSRRQILILKNSAMRRGLPGVLDDATDFLQVERFVTYPDGREVLPIARSEQALAPIANEDRAYLEHLYQEDAEAMARDFAIDVWTA